VAVEPPYDWPGSYEVTVFISKVVGDFGGQKLFGKPERLENVCERSKE